MDKAKFQAAEQHFKTIRDERGLRANTATRIGAAFLELLYLLQELEGESDFDNIDISNAKIARFINSPIFEKGLQSLASILVGNYQEGRSGAAIDASGNAEFQNITVRDKAELHNIITSPTFLKGLLTLGTIVFGNYQEGESGGYIDANGNGELESLKVRTGMTIDQFLNNPTFKEGLKTLGSIILGDYIAGEKGGILNAEGFSELKELFIRELARMGKLRVEGESVFNGDLSSPDFISGFLGGLGWAIQKQEVTNAAGEIETKYHLEIDNVSVRGTLRVFEMIISQLLGENGNRFFSDMMEVDHYDPVTQRIWLNTQNGKLYNPFRVGDLIIVQQYNGEPTSENNWYVTKSYELRITGVGIGDQQGADRLDWVTFDNFTSSVEGLTPASAISKGDTLVRADNETNKNRKGLMTMMSVGENTPYMDILYGMKTDPKHALKGRTGNLEGIITDVFGSLEGFGAYMNNLYAVGKFFNAQTGESFNARIEATKTRLRSVYKETTYNISDEENFISNGFFQNELECWSKCNIDGSNPEAETQDGVLSVGGSPLFVNGQLLNTKSKATANTEVLDDITVLHLRGMGVSQSFSLIKVNGSHKEMNSGTGSDTTTKDVADTLYMGVRMLPVTSGTLTVRFIKEDGSTSGWEREINSSTSWQLQQARDYVEMPWQYSGNGKLVVSYTGECYIRFIALRADAIANARVDYATLFEQTSRRITLEATRLSSDLQTAVAAINLTVDGISTTVSDNKTAADLAFKKLTDDLDAEVTARQGLAGEYHGTWAYQNDHLLSLMAAEFNADGTIKGYADLIVKVNGIDTTVTNNKTATDAALKKLTDDLKDESDQNDTRATNLATWQTQTSSRIDAIAGKWDANGNLIGYSTTSQTASAISSAVAGLATSQSVTDLDTKLSADIAQLESDLQAESDQNDTRATNLATWQTQTSSRIDAIAGKWDANGNLIGYSTTSQTASAISTAVAGLATSDSVTNLESRISTQLQNLGGSIEDLEDAIEAESDQNDTRASNLATWQQQTESSISDIAGKWDSNGDLIGYTRTTQLWNAIRQDVVNMGYVTNGDVTTRLSSYYTKTETDQELNIKFSHVINSNLLTGLNDGNGWSCDGFTGSSCTFSSQNSYMECPVMDLPAGTYTFSCAILSQDVPGLIEINVVQFDDDEVLCEGSIGGDFDGSERLSYTFTLTSPARLYIAIDAIYDGNDFNVIRPKLECGSEATPWSTEAAVTDSYIKFARNLLEIDLGAAGVNISGNNRKIELIADKVSFCYYDNGIKKSDKVWIDSTSGTIHAVDAVFEGSLIFDKVKMIYGAYNGIGHSYIYGWDTYYDEDQGDVVPSVPLVLQGNIWCIYGRKCEPYTFYFPPASSFPGARIKIINGTHNAYSDFQPDRSTVRMIVSHPHGAEERAEDNDNIAKNHFAVFIPFKASNGNGAYGYFEELTWNLYDSIELISTKNPWNSDYYVWMIIAADRQSSIENTIENYHT